VGKTGDIAAAASTAWLADRRSPNRQTRTAKTAQGDTRTLPAENRPARVSGNVIQLKLGLKPPPTGPLPASIEEQKNSLAQ
jgi:hypothetical protein